MMTRVGFVCTRISLRAFAICAFLVVAPAQYAAANDPGGCLLPPLLRQLAVAAVYDFSTTGLSTAPVLNFLQPFSRA